MTSNLKTYTITFLIVSFFGIQSTFGQIGVSLGTGIPIGDSKDLSSVSATVDLVYFFDVVDNLKIGPSAGFIYSFGEKIDTGFGILDFDDSRFLPLYAASRFDVSKTLHFGVDMGYAISLGTSFSGGLYYAPRVSLSLNEYLDVFMAYRGISLNTSTWDIVALGLEVQFN